MPSKTDKFYRYQQDLLAAEKNNVTLKDEALLSVALVFPNRYEVAMANLGFQTLYRLLNQYPGVRCERAFFHPSFQDPPRSLETGRQLNHFDIIAFSISFELDFINALTLLKNSGLQLYAEHRHARDPLIIAGGTATFINPEPMAPFVDLFVLGEVEPVLSLLLVQLLSMKAENMDKQHILSKLGALDGFYAPAIVRAPDQPVRVVSSRKDDAPQFSSIITAHSHFGEMFLIEVGRGCGRHCRFCAASHVYHPLRFFSLSDILTSIEKNIRDTTRVGLVGAALCDYPDILELCEELVNRDYQLGLSSFRFETISSRFLNILKRGKVESITLAPEAGSFRLRQMINKPIPDELILTSLEAIAGSHIAHVKLYFLIGLPFEEDADILGMIGLIRRSTEIFSAGAGRKRELAVSINAFVPKAFTPFQWCGMADEKSLREKRRLIARELRGVSGIRITQKNAKHEMLEGILSLGNRDVAQGLAKLVESSTDLNSFIAHHQSDLLQKKSYQSPLPWDFISYRVSREKLWQEWLKTE